MKLIQISLYLSLLFLLALPTSAHAELSIHEVNHLLICYQEQIASKTAGREKFEVAFSHYPKDQLYKLFIDRARLAHPTLEERKVDPHLIFDLREPGYYQSMIDAFQLVQEELGSRITFDSIIKLHDVAVGRISGMEKGYASGGYSYQINSNRIHKEAIDELIQSRILMDLSRQIQLFSEQPLFASKEHLELLATSIFRTELNLFLAKYSELSETIKIESKFRNELRERIEFLLDHYYSQISSMTSLQGKLAAISELLRALEVAHFLPDGNQRTYAFLLLNQLLIENSIPPAILADPFMFDGFLPVRVLAERVRSGVVRFLNESEASQRNFLRQHCKIETLSSSQEQYLFAPGVDYRPLYQIELPWMVRPERYQREIEKAIQTGDIEKKGLNAPIPLVQAIFLGSIELVDQLIEIGAQPFSPSYNKSPFKIAHELGSLKLAIHLLESAPPNTIDQPLIEEAILAEVRLRRDLSNSIKTKRRKYALLMMDALLRRATDETLKSRPVLNALGTWSKTWLTKYPKSAQERLELLRKYQITFPE
jgi:hypothetical protein